MFHKCTKQSTLIVIVLGEALAGINTFYLAPFDQLVDLLTKGLSYLQCSHLLSKLGMINIFSVPSLKEGIEVSTNVSEDNKLVVASYQLVS